jgi:hypothetical protein
MYFASHPLVTVSHFPSVVVNGLSRYDSSNPKICDHENVSVVNSSANQNVGWFEVTMHDTFWDSLVSKRHYLCKPQHHLGCHISADLSLGPVLLQNPRA